MRLRWVHTRLNFNNSKKIFKQLKYLTRKESRLCKHYWSHLSVSSQHFAADIKESVIHYSINPDFE